MTAATPGQAARELPDRPTDGYARWFRIVYPAAPDDTVARTWRGLLDAEREFWRELDAAQGARPAPGTPADALRRSVEARVELWRQESKPLTTDTRDELTERHVLGDCARSLADDLATWQEQARDFTGPQAAPEPFRLRLPKPTPEQVAAWRAELDEPGPHVPFPIEDAKPAPEPHRHPFAAGPCACDASCECWHAIPQPKPAPELAAAMREARLYRERLDAIRKLCEARINAVGMVDGKGVARKVIAVIDKPEGK